MTSEDNTTLSSAPDVQEQPHSSDERTWAALAHASTLLNFVVGLGGLIAAGLIWLTKKKESEWVAFHGLQSLVFQGVELLATLIVVGGTWVVGFAFSFLTLGIGTMIAVPLMMLTFFIGILIMFGGLVYSLYGAYQIYNGQDFRYLWVGDWIERRSFGQTIGQLAAAEETSSPTNNTFLLILAGVVVVLVLCTFCAVFGLLLLALVGGLVAYSTSAWLPGLLVG